MNMWGENKWVLIDEIKGQRIVRMNRAGERGRTQGCPPVQNVSIPPADKCSALCNVVSWGCPPEQCRPPCQVCRHITHSRGSLSEMTELLPPVHAPRPQPARRLPKVPFVTRATLLCKRATSWSAFRHVVLCTLYSFNPLGTLWVAFTSTCKSENILQRNISMWKIS